MKAAIFTILFMSLGSLSFSIHAEEAADSTTDAGSAAVNACFGACEKDNNQLNLTTSPYEVDKRWNEINKIRSKDSITPKDLQDGKAQREDGMDI
jgi:hypothetical protein